ncbi:MAG: thiamine pyrophosphate-dependent dehydrogenase E1 component subunit alpha [Sciscionella sp.]
MTVLSDCAEQTRPSDNELASIYRTMATITTTESETVGAVRAGRLNAAVYPVHGLEAVCGVMGALLERTDYLVSTYRNLGDAIAKGVSITEIVAESYGRVGGTSRGMGGPMHLADVRVGLMATSGIVGGGVPSAVGLALAAQLDDEGQIAVTTFGDGATSIGATHEAMNMAALWKLPIVFLCQNNQWGEHTALREYAANPVLAERAAAYGMRAEQVDGFDPIATWNVLRSAFEHARSGAGPVFVEALTYRLGPHSAASDFRYMPKDDFAAAMQRDPTPSFRTWLIDNGVTTEQALAQIDAEVAEEVSTAMQAAVDSPLPDLSNLLDNVYADKSVLPSRSARWRNDQ